jgi:DnaJ-class molecular chaperone
MALTCDKCNGSGGNGILSSDGRQYACQKCEGTGKLVEISEEEGTLAWAKSLVKVVCHSCGGKPWTAKDGCGSCSHHGYNFRDPTKNGPIYKLRKIQFFESQAISGSLLQVVLSKCICSKPAR